MMMNGGARGARERGERPACERGRVGAGEGERVGGGGWVVVAVALLAHRLLTPPPSFSLVSLAARVSRAPPLSKTHTQVRAGLVGHADMLQP